MLLRSIEKSIGSAEFKQRLKWRAEPGLAIDKDVKSLLDERDEVESICVGNWLNAEGCVRVAASNE